MLSEICLGIASYVPSRGRALEDSDRSKDRRTYQTPNTRGQKYGSKSVGAKLHRTKGKQPESQLKVPKFMLSTSEVVDFLRR